MMNFYKNYNNDKFSKQILNIRGRWVEETLQEEFIFAKCMQDLYVHRSISLAVMNELIIRTHRAPLRLQVFLLSRLSCLRFSHFMADRRAASRQNFATKKKLQAWRRFLFME